MENYLLFIVLPNLSAFFAIVGIGGLVATLVLFLCTMDDYRDEKQNDEYIKAHHKMLLIFLGCLFVSCFMPSTRQIVQLKVISTISELKGVEQIPQKMVDRINDLLDFGKKENAN